MFYECQQIFSGKLVRSSGKCHKKENRCSQGLLCFSSIRPTSALYISSPCPVSLRSLVSRVPELRGAHCTLHGSPSRESGTRVLAARGHTPGKWGRNPQLIHSTPVLTQFPLLKVSACEKGCQQDCGAHFGDGEDGKRCYSNGYWIRI